MSRSFVAASSQRINVPVLAATGILTRVTFTLTFVFKSTNSGTTRLSLYGVDTDTSASLMHLSLNDLTGNGGIRFARRDNSSNFCDMRYNVADINLCDGAWHIVSVIGRALNDYEMLIDGVSKATNTTNVSGTGGTIQHTIVGGRFVQAGTYQDFFDGTIAEKMIHSVALTVEQCQALHARTKNAFNVTGNAAHLIAYRPMINLGTGDNRNLAPGRINDAAPTFSASVPGSADGPYGVVPWGMTESCDPGTMWVLSEPTVNLFAGSTTSTDVDYLLREPSNVLHTPLDVGKEYKIYAAGSPDPYASNDPSLILYYSSDEVNWTKHGVVIAPAQLAVEDPYVVLDPDDGTYHMWAENKTGRNNHLGIAYLTSPDGIDWTVVDGSAVLDSGSGGWDDDDVSSPTVWFEGAAGARTWYMLYEGRQVAGVRGQMGLTTASAPEGTWTKYASNPVMAVRAGEYDSNSIIVDDIVKIGANYHVFYHCTDAAAVISCARAVSTDLHSWTRTANDLLVKANVTFNLQNMRTAFGHLYGYKDENSTPFQLHRGFGDAAVQAYEWPEVPTQIDCGVGGLAIAGLAGTVTIGEEGEPTVVTATVGALALAGRAASVLSDTAVTAGVGAMALSGLAATVSIGSVGTATMVSIRLVDSSGNPRANLSGLRWAAFDELTLDMLDSPTDQGDGATTDTNGMFVQPLTGTTKVPGDRVLLMISDSDGTITQTPSERFFGGPVEIS